MINWKEVERMYADGHGTSKIGEKFHVPANTIRRGLIKRGIQMRTQSEAQKLQLEKGFLKHPTEGKLRSSTIKEKIAKSCHKAYDDLPEEEKKKRTKRSKEQWENRPKELVEEMKEKASSALRKAAREGSKLERFLVDKISETGRLTNWHRNDFLENVDLEVDILLPEDKIAIEVDGVFHFQPVFSEEQYEKTLRADTEKNGLLLKNGYCVIRIRNTKKNTSNILHEKLWVELEKLLDSINKNFPEVTNRLFELEL